MEPICPIDQKCASQISSLLQPPPPFQVQEYFEELVTKRQRPGIKVKQDGQLGKGVYAEVNFEEGDLILRDQMLFGIQHTPNKIDCHVCSFCFQFIGSIELQVGRKLYLQSLGMSASNGHHDGVKLHISEACSNTDSSDNEDSLCVEEPLVSRECASSSSTDRLQLPEGVVQSLMNGELVLPHSSKFPLPSAIPCPGGCGEAYYCSQLCAEADWEASHSLLCTGERSKCPSREALKNFIHHANQTNDIFLLAAKTLAFAMLRYRKLKDTHLKEQDKITMSVVDCFSLLLEAWKPISIGYKKRWWDCISLPEDVDSSDEAAFRMDVRELAFTSLQLLKAAIFDEECEPLFSLEIYGNFIGMFELNNLDLVVASPVEDYFLYIDVLPSVEKEQAQKVTQPLLEALGEDYSVCCQGTAFYPLQSCMNHSCCPNAKAFKRDEDRDGQATIIATKTIFKGQEVTISYIDEELSYEERQALLADYGFGCRCTKCLEELEPIPDMQ